MEPEGRRRIQTFSTDGYLCLPRELVKDSDQVQEWTNRFASNQFFRQIFADLHQHGHISGPTHMQMIPNTDHEAFHKQDDQTPHGTTIQYKYAMGLGVKHGFREIVMRSPGRYEIAITNESYRQAIVDSLSKSLPFAPALLGGDLSWSTVKVVNVSIVVSTPGATEQGWHADGGHLDLHRHLPCHCLNIFIPLSPVTDTNGPTELRPGSHYYTRQLTPLLLAAKARKTLRPCEAPNLVPGDCLLFDYRILHRGKANRTRVILSDDESQSPHRNNQQDQLHRTILVVAIAQQWFKDVVNFPSRSIYDKPLVETKAIEIP